MEPTKQCSACINPRICYIQEDNKGWCNECNFCREKGCTNRVANRMYWTAGCDGNPTELYRDICKGHSNIPSPYECECSKTARGIRVIPFIYE